MSVAPVRLIMAERITTRQQLEEDQQVEQTLRPNRWDEYVGQDKVKDNLQVFIQGRAEI